MKAHKVAAEDQSRWSVLPENIIHQIISLLSGTKEAARTCMLCKWWVQACRSYPFLVFIEREDQSTEIVERFYEFVDATMSGFDKRRSGIQRFVLDSTFLKAKGVDYLFDKWITIALNNHVQEMTLSNINLYKVPEMLLNSGSLKSLSLNFPGCETIVPHTALINLTSLQSLTLSMPNIDSRTLKRFLKGCPLLKYLDLEIFNLDEESFDEFLCDFTSLETLKLTFKRQTETPIGISNPSSIKTFELHIWKPTAGIIIDIPSLSFFRYVEHIGVGVASKQVLLKNPPHNCQAHLTLQLHHLAVPTPALKELISLFSNLRSLTFLYHRQELGAKETETLLPPPSNFKSEGLNVTIDVLHPLYEYTIETMPPLYLYKVILHRLLSICQPDIITLAAWVRAHSQERDSLKVKYWLQRLLKMLENREEEFECNCSGDVNCWKHQLKEVEIDEDESNKLQDPHQCPINYFGDFVIKSKICFRLKW